jgi:hypothetical protein
VTSNVLPLKQPPVGWCVAGTPENLGKNYALTQFAPVPTQVPFGLPQLLG